MSSSSSLTIPKGTPSPFPGYGVRFFLQSRLYQDLRRRPGDQDRADSSPIWTSPRLNSLPNEFIADEGYRKANDISVNEDGWTEVGGRDTRIFSLTRTPRPESEVAHNSYTYAYIKTGGLTYYTVHFRYDSFERNKDRIREILNSLVFFAPQAPRLTIWISSPFYRTGMTRPRRSMRL